jgi:uncharacterized membrane protein
MNDVRVFSLIIAVIIAGVVMLAPTFTPRRYYFGLTVAPGFYETEAGRAIRRGYIYAVAGALALALAVIIAFPHAALATAMILVPLAAAVAFFHSRNRVRHYSTPAAAIREAEVSRGPERLPLWALLALPPFIPLLAVAAYLRAHWAEIPARFAVHWGLDGEPNRWVLRSARTVYGPLWFGAGMMLV